MVSGGEEAYPDFDTSILKKFGSEIDYPLGQEFKKDSPINTEMAVFKWDWTHHLNDAEKKALKDKQKPRAVSPAKMFDLRAIGVERVVMTKEELRRINEEQDELLEAEKQKAAEEGNM